MTRWRTFLTIIRAVLILAAAAALVAVDRELTEAGSIRRIGAAVAVLWAVWNILRDLGAPSAGWLVRLHGWAYSAGVSLIVGGVLTAAIFPPALVFVAATVPMVTCGAALIVLDRRLREQERGRVRAETDAIGVRIAEHYRQGLG